jgi:hypothetical protein
MEIDYELAALTLLVLDYLPSLSDRLGDVGFVETPASAPIVSVVYPLNPYFYWKNPDYLYNKRGEPGESDIIERK